MISIRQAPNHSLPRPSPGTELRQGSPSIFRRRNPDFDDPAHGAGAGQLALHRRAAFLYTLRSRIPPSTRCSPMANLFRYRRPSLKTMLGITAEKKKIKRELGITALTKPFRFWGNEKRRRQTRAGLLLAGVEIPAAGSPATAGRRRAQTPLARAATWLDAGRTGVGRTGGLCRFAIFGQRRRIRGRHHRCGNRDDPCRTSVVGGQSVDFSCHANTGQASNHCRPWRSIQSVASSGPHRPGS